MAANLMAAGRGKVSGRHDIDRVLSHAQKNPLDSNRNSNGMRQMAPRLSSLRCRQKLAASWPRGGAGRKSGRKAALDRVYPMRRFYFPFWALC